MLEIAEKFKQLEVQGDLQQPARRCEKYSFLQEINRYLIDLKALTISEWALKRLLNVYWFTMDLSEQRHSQKSSSTNKSFSLSQESC